MIRASGGHYWGELRGGPAASWEERPLRWAACPCAACPFGRVFRQVLHRGGGAGCGVADGASSVRLAASSVLERNVLYPGHSGHLGPGAG